VRRHPNLHRRPPLLGLPSLWDLVSAMNPLLAIRSRGTCRHDQCFPFAEYPKRGACPMESILGIASLFGIFAMLAALYWRFVPWYTGLIVVNTILRFYDFAGNRSASISRRTSVILRPSLAHWVLIRVCSSSGTSSVKRFICTGLAASAPARFWSTLFVFLLRFFHRSFWSVLRSDQRP